MRSQRGGALVLGDEVIGAAKEVFESDLSKGRSARSADVASYSASQPLPNR